MFRKEGFQVDVEKPIMNSFFVPQTKASNPLASCENSSSNCSLANDSAAINNEVKKKKTKLKNLGVFSKNEIPPQLEEILCKFCESGGFAGVQVVENNTVMALCTPLMLRVHTLVKQSGELVFVDAYGDLNEPDSCKVYVFFTYCSAGTVPLGCIVTTSASANCIKAALDLWKSIVPKGLFYNKRVGPDVFFTSDNDAERQGLKLSFPKSHLLICSSHILQASWMFLLDHRNIIKKEHRSAVLSKIKMLLFSQCVEDLQMNYTCAVADPLIKSNTVFLDYIKNIYDHRYDWSLLYWRHLLPHGNDLSIFWPSSFILQRDPILSRSKTFNALQIVDLLPRLDTYYERKLIDLANNRVESVRLSRFMFIDVPKEAYVITQNSEIDYEVHNDTKDTAYQVDVSLGVCECRTGKAGAPCKHQLLIFRNFPILVYDCVPPSTPAEKSFLLQLATNQDLAKELTPETAQPVAPESCNPGITIQDLDACGGGDFFLDENGISASHQTLISQINASILSQSVVIPPTSALEDHHEPGISDGILPSPNLLASQTISLLEPLMLDQPPLEPLCPKDSESSVSQIIDKICCQLKSRTEKSPASFRPALGAFLKNLESLTSNSSLEYALYSFGKFSKFNTPLFKRKIVDNKLTGMQSTGKIKRKKNATSYS